VVDAGANTPKADLKDFIVLIESPGVWQRREVARPAGDGLYTVEYVIPRPGVYLVFAASPSAGLDYSQYATVTVQGGSN